MTASDRSNKKTRVGTSRRDFLITSGRVAGASALAGVAVPRVHAAEVDGELSIDEHKHVIVPREPENLPSQIGEPGVKLKGEVVVVIAPLIAEELRDAEKTYPADWIEEAFRIAVEHNARRWRYVRSILERWAAEGKDREKASRGPEEDRRRYIEGKYAEYIEH